MFDSLWKAFINFSVIKKLLNDAEISH